MQIWKGRMGSTCDEDRREKSSLPGEHELEPIAPEAGREQFEGANKRSPGLPPHISPPKDEQVEHDTGEEEEGLELTER